MPTESHCGADDLGNNLFTELGGTGVSVPAVDLTDDAFQIPVQAGNPLFDDVTRFDNDSLTTIAIDGTGVFDVLMRANKLHLQAEFEKGRITGDQYSKVYIQMMNGAMSTGVQFLLGRDQAYWNALLVQAQARSAEAEAVSAAVAIETAKNQLALINQQAEGAQAAVALTKMQLANEDVKYCIAEEQRKQAEFTTTTLQPIQENLLQEQVEAKRAETLDTRSDDVTPVTGTVGKQKELYSQQIDSYQKDSAYKVGKLFSDAWTVQKTIDEGVLAPTNYTNAEIDEVLSALRTGVNLGTT